MISLASLWAPILASAVFVFIASSISHSVLRFHRSDYARLSGEDVVMDLLRKLTVSPGDYVFPLAADAKAMKAADFQEKWKRGPVGVMTVLPNGGHPMGRTFTLWFLYCITVGLFAAFIASRSLAPAASEQDVFLLTGVAAFGGHALAYWPASIWYGRSWGTTVRLTVDALVYGTVTGGAFDLLWPR